MKTTQKSLWLTAIVLLLSVVAFGQNQYPVNPNPSGRQTTPYSAYYFSATFDGEVSTNAYRNGENTSSNFSYASFSQGVGQSVIVRFVDHDVSVDFTTSNFYADNDDISGPITDRSTGKWEGHPYTYTRHVFTKDGVELQQRTRYIIVNSREAIFINQISPNSYADRDQWLDFEYSLRIK